VADTKPTVWSAEPHTLAKHGVLSNYLIRWMPILSFQSHRVGSATATVKVYDAFAGPGIYEGREPGSPILALQAALNHSAAFPVPIELVFIENDRDRCDTLQSQLRLYREQLAATPKVRVRDPICGDCETELNRLLDRCDETGEPFGPGFVFLDQFGYSAVPMRLIKRIMDQPQCEVLSYLFWRDMDRFLTDPTKHAGITAAFGGNEWEPAINMPGEKRAAFMRDTYLQALRVRGGAKLVWPFSMLDANERLLYWLFFSTNNIRGLEEMKKAMWKVDRTGSFAFSDRDGFEQLKFLISFDDTWLAEHMAGRFRGQTLTVGEINEYVLTQTPCYKFRESLGLLERDGRAVPVNPPPSRQRCSYTDDSLKIRFVGNLFS
jgi:three-Cys-motif partner protein